jgi:WD40 repeat protein
MSNNSNNMTSNQANNSNGIIQIPARLYDKAEGFITITKYNNEGSLLYIGDNASKKIIVVETKKSMIVNIFTGQNGVSLDIDFTDDDEFMVSSSGDCTMMLRNAKTGEQIRKLNTIREMLVPQRMDIQKNMSSKYLMVYYKNKSSNPEKKSRIDFFDLEKMFNTEIPDTETKIKSIQWNYSNEITAIKWISETKYVIGTEDGMLMIKSIEDDEYCHQEKIHSDSINTINFNLNKSVMLTSSSDSTAKEVEIENLNVLAEYKSNGNINSAIYSQKDRLIIIGGGMEATKVAKSGGSGDLSIKIIRKKDKKLIREINGHNSVVRTINGQPNSKNFVSGGHNGTAIVYLLDKLDDDDENKESEQSSTNDEQTIGVINKSEFMGIYDFTGTYLKEINVNINQVNVQKMINDKKIRDNQKQNNVVGMKSSSTEPSNELFMIDDSVDYVSEIKRKNKEKVKQNQDDGDELISLIDRAINNKSGKFTGSDNESDNEEEQQSQEPGAVKVTNLPMDYDFYELKKLIDDMFSSFGRIKHIGIDRKNTYDRVAYVNYMSKDSAIKAINIYTENKQRIGLQVMGVELAIPRQY